MMNTVHTPLSLEVKSSLLTVTAQSERCSEKPQPLSRSGGSADLIHMGKGTTGSGEVRSSEAPDKDSGMKWLGRDRHREDESFQPCPCLSFRSGKVYRQLCFVLFFLFLVVLYKVTYE